MNYGHDTSESQCGGRCLLDIIRSRAYQIFEARGHQSGHELEHWLEAENEIKHHLGFNASWHRESKPSI